jgi:hypothetical protein
MPNGSQLEITQGDIRESQIVENRSHLIHNLDDSDIRGLVKPIGGLVVGCDSG